MTEKIKISLSFCLQFPELQGWGSGFGIWGAADNQTTASFETLKAKTIYKTKSKELLKGQCRFS